MAYTASVVWKEGMHFEGISGGQTVHMDAVPAVGGQGLGMSPMRLLLASLGGCTAMDVISLLKKMRQDVTGLEVEVNAEQAADHPKVYTSFELVFKVRGHNVARELVERAVHLSEDKYCSASAMLKKAAPITTRIEIEEDKA